MKIRFTILSVMLHCCLASQTDKTLSVWVNPIVQKIGNLNKQFTDVSHPNILVKYHNKPGFESGLRYSLNFKNDVGIDFQAIWGLQKYSIDYQANRFYPGGNYENQQFEVLSFRDYRFSRSMIGFGAGMHYDFTENLRVNFLFNSYLVYSVVHNQPEKVHTTFGSAMTDPPFGFTEKISITNAIKYPVTIPELSISYKFLNYFRFTAGFKLKFWDKYDYFNIDVFGDFNSDQYIYDETRVIHRSAINSREMSYYFGLAFEIPTKTK